MLSIDRVLNKYSKGDSSAILANVPMEYLGKVRKYGSFSDGYHVRYYGLSGKEVKKSGAVSFSVYLA